MTLASTEETITNTFGKKKGSKSYHPHSSCNKLVNNMLAKSKLHANDLL
jgi:hypothetical protein